MLRADHLQIRRMKMVRPLSKVLVLLFVISCCSGTASANTVGVGLLTFDSDTPTALAAFDILNLTGSNAFPTDFPITTQLTITVTNLVANIDGGGTLTLPGSDFSAVDPQGDVDCTVVGDAGSGGCDFAAYNLLSATLTGTLSPSTGLAGLPAGNSIVSAFTTTITPACGTDLTTDCDAAEIDATVLPEPSTWILFSTALIGLLVGHKIRTRAEGAGAA